jgi:hypothetical protein
VKGGGSEVPPVQLLPKVPIQHPVRSPTPNRRGR